MLEIHSLLAAQGQNLFSTHGGPPDITPQMVAACLAQAPKGGALIIRIKVGDWTARRELGQIFRQRMAHEAGVRKWKTGPNFWQNFEGLCDACLHYYVLPDTCGRCRGVGTIMRRNLAIECPVCGGAGRKEAKESQKAATAQIPYQSWRDTWADRYALGIGILSGWEDEADQVTKRLFWVDS